MLEKSKSARIIKQRVILFIVFTPFENSHALFRVQCIIADWYSQGLYCMDGPFLWMKGAEEGWAIKFGIKMEETNSPFLLMVAAGIASGISCRLPMRSRKPLS